MAPPLSFTAIGKPYSGQEMWMYRHLLPGPAIKAFQRIICQNRQKSAWETHQDEGAKQFHACNATGSETIRKTRRGHVQETSVLLFFEKEKN
jgi:hypothetical protein